MTHVFNSKKGGPKASALGYIKEKRSRLQKTQRSVSKILLPGLTPVARLGCFEEPFPFPVEARLLFR